jgi:hypothetical protein
MEVCCPLRVVLNNSWAWHPRVVWKKGVKSDFHDTLWSSSTILSCSQRLCCNFLCSSVITIVQFWGTFYEKISKWESLYYNTIGRFLRDCRWGATHSERDLLNFSALMWYFFQNTLKILSVSLLPIPLQKSCSDRCVWLTKYIGIATWVWGWFWYRLPTVQ